MDPSDTLEFNRDASDSAARNRRFEILAQADVPPLHTLAEAVLADEEHFPIHVVTPPRPGVLMLRLREPVRGTVFNAGEVLVTEAAVSLGGTPGYGMRLGREPETALAAAILDAAVAAGHPLSSRIAAFLGEQERDVRERDVAAWRGVAPTRVAFEEMHQ